MKAATIPNPAMLFVSCDEHPDSINDGYFLNTENGQWTDMPASYHNGGGSFSFADGHTEIHHWRSLSTLRPAKPFSVNLPISLRADDQADLNWVLQHSSVEQPNANNTPIHTYPGR